MRRERRKDEVGVGVYGEEERREKERAMEMERVARSNLAHVLCMYYCVCTMQRWRELAAVPFSLRTK